MNADWVFLLPCWLDYWFVNFKREGICKYLLGFIFVTWSHIQVNTSFYNCWFIVSLSSDKINCACLYLSQPTYIHPTASAYRARVVIIYCGYCAHILSSLHLPWQKSSLSFISSRIDWKAWHVPTCFCLFWFTWSMQMHHKQKKLPQLEVKGLVDV